MGTKMTKILFSYKFVLILLAILAIGAGIATFLESIYDTATAQIYVYEALWYEALMLLISISLLGIIIKSKMYRHFGAFAIHIAFIIIIFGAFMTRFFGEEGVLHVREGESSSEMISVKPYLQIRIDDDIYEYYTKLSQIGENDFTIIQPIDGKDFIIKFQSYEPSIKGRRSNLNVLAGFNDNLEAIRLNGGIGWLGEPKVVEQDGKQIMLSWGSKLTQLPFSIKLLNFKLQRYPGSQSPSSYASDIEVFKGEKKVLEYEIFMNNPLVFDGYKFFQSSYDKDERGTILEINRDPGKIPTYIGYFLLCVGFIGNFFTPKSRFAHLSKFIKNSQILLIFVLIFFINFNLQAADEGALEHFKQNTKAHANGEFATLLVQDFMGRTKPISTQAFEVLSKMSMSESLFGLSPEQVVLGMSTNPTLWQDLKTIRVKNSEIKKLLNLNTNEKFVSFNFMFDEQGMYKLAKEVDNANAKPASKRSKLDNDLIKFDERINIAYLTLKGVFFRFVPVKGDADDKWLSPNDAFMAYGLDKEAKVILNDYLVGLESGVAINQWDKANEALHKLKQYQRVASSHALPSDTQIKAEVFYNKFMIFKKLVYFYMILGFVALGLGFVSVFRTKKFKTSKSIIFWLFVFGFIAHTLGLIIRAYISGHAPWSDSYESMIYIGWSAVLAGIVFFRSSLLSIAASAILASIVMLVAHMSFVNPQITNLVPVLKSYWLSIHVSVITASYGFLGLSCLLGLLGLILMSLKNFKNQPHINEQIRYITAINEISLIVGLSMLTVGNFFGGVWANESWGRYWGWDSKETWSFVSIIVYAIVLHLRFVPKLNSIYAFCVASMFAYSSIIMTYFGVNFYLTGMHSYAAGEAPGVPNTLYYIIAILIALSVFAYRGKNIKNI
ncbi:cytochrome c biogenesis protein CcsA [Campylobacter sp. faydin G-105]|uniref:cytochrome c biogenesis protein n=1 Tax=Campylobacter anatolicus TaxID=2829105 RepID=UPI001B902C66|nr:cytochrome c biogenesis protein CcsA [Campylobacter anatolicus]MBR8461328.1 cytochrome c biogenesis protein CcsA [Campylobacter anatolicus]